jgi:Uri superfamily endonuclease
LGKSFKIGRGIVILRGAVIEFTQELNGTYMLYLEITEPSNVKVKGKEILLDNGFYIYVGSAFGGGGLSSRIHRHLRREKKSHWHIDQITSKDICQFHGVAAFPNEKSECSISNSLSKINKLRPIKDFGNSDCTNKCISHFFYVKS